MKWIRLIALSWMLALVATAQVLQPVNLGTALNDGTGDPIRTALQKLNNNDSNLWNQAFVVQVATNALVARRKVVNSFAELLTVDPNTTDQVEMLGYYGPGRGGYSIYTLTNTIAGTNQWGGRVLALGGSKAWQINASNGQINSRQFGAFPGTNGAAGPIIDKLFEYCSANLLTAVVGTGDHYLTNTVYLRNNTSIDAEPNAWLVRNWTSPIDTRFGMVVVLGDLWPNGYLDTNVTTFDIVATNIVIKNIGLRSASTNNVGFPLTISNARFVTVDGVKIGLCGYAWGITFLANDIAIRNCQINTTDGTTGTIYTDGIHGIGGDRFIIENNNIWTGDDMIALSSLGSIGFKDGLVQNNIVSSAPGRGHAIRMQQDRPYSSAIWTNIVIRGITGSAGTEANAGILIQNLSTNGYNPFRGITLADIKLRVGNLSTQGGGTNYSGGNRGIYIDYAENLLLQNISVSRSALENFDIEKSTGVVLENCFGEGAEWWFRNATIRLDGVTNATIRGGEFRTLTTSIVSNSVPLYIVGSQDVFVHGASLTNQNASAGAVLLGGSQSGFVSLIGNKMASAAYGVHSVINPTSIIVLGNKIEAPTPASWQGSAPPSSSVIANNIGLSSLGRSEATGFDLMNSSSGLYVGGTDLRGNYETRFQNASGMFFFAQDAINGGTKTVRIGAQPSSSSGKPTIIAAATDNASFPLVFLGYGSSLMDGAPWVNFGAAPTPYSAGVYLGNWTSTGMKIEPGGSPGSQETSSVLELKSTTSGFLPPRMTGTQRDAIGSPIDGLILFNSTTGKLQVRSGGAWVDLH